MKNLELAKIFYEIAQYLEMEDIPFKPYAYQNAANSLERLEQDIREIYKKGGVTELDKIPGIGKNIAQKIEEYLKTGKIKEYEKLKKKIPVNLQELVSVEGMGVKKIKVLYQKLKIRNLNDLEKAAKLGKIQKLFGFGSKVEKNILRGIEFSKKTQGRFLLGFILPTVRGIEAKLKSLEATDEVCVAGSVRRMKETIGDIDILAVSSQPSKVMNFFVSMPEVEKVYAQGRTKSSVRLKLGLDADLRVVAKKSYGSALQYFTGSKDHNISTRKIAQKKKLKLNEYGVFKNRRQIAGRTEREIYQALDLSYIEPEMREDQGEITLALKGKLPKIVGYQDIKGDLHTHTTWSDGSHSIKEMAETAKKLGHQYILIADHTGELSIAGGMDEKTILKQMAEIDRIDKKLSGIKILKGVEVNIRKDGNLDIRNEVLAKLDIVLAAVHSNFKMSKPEMTKRICRAITNPHVDILSHPTGRLIQRREGYQLDLDKIFKVAKETETVLEINAYPNRLDLNNINIKKAIDAGVKLSIATDSHNREHLSYIELGIAQARRGWAEKKDIINTQPLEKLLKKAGQY